MTGLRLVVTVQLLRFPASNPPLTKSAWARVATTEGCSPDPQSATANRHNPRVKIADLCIGLLQAPRLVWQPAHVIKLRRRASILPDGNLALFAIYSEVCGSV